MHAFRETLLNSSRLSKQIIVSFSDFMLIYLSILFSYSLLEMGDSPAQGNNLWTYLLIPLISVLSLFSFGTYRSVLRYIDLSVIYTLINAIFFSFLVFIILRLILQINISHISDQSFNLINHEVPFWVLSLFSSFVFTIGIRLLAYLFFSDKNSDKRVIIYGAGSAGIQLAEALKVSKEMN